MALKCFPAFRGGGGSSMGYKLAGYNVLGCCEIDEKMLECYRTNLNPKISYLMPIQDIVFDTDKHKEIGDIDILDGSPPCSVFSLSGNREQDWGKVRAFAEGQAVQILDDLFFHFISLADKLRPRVVIAENVKGLILGNAKGYVKKIFTAFKEIGYTTQLFLLNASQMGVPQRRERVFFIARRDKIPPISLSFSETEIPISMIIGGVDILNRRKFRPIIKQYWKLCAPGKLLSSVHPKKHLFNWCKLSPNKPAPTLLARGAAAGQYLHWSEQRTISYAELARIQSFPDDYNYCKQNPGYVIGMSVPPIMMHRLSARVADWLLNSNARL